MMSRLFDSTQEIARIGVAGGGLKCASRAEAGGLGVAEGPPRPAAVGPQLFVGLQPLELPAEGEGMASPRPLQVVLQCKRVRCLVECFGIANALAQGRIGTVERDIGEGGSGLSRSARLIPLSASNLRQSWRL